MDLSIIIVNWNSAEFLRKCLASIYQDAGRPDSEIIVIDNASQDGCAGIIRERFPQVLFISSQANLGFARANNLGYRHSHGRVLLFLNPDTEVRPGALRTMYEQLCADSRAGAIGCRLLNTDLSLQTTCLQAFPTIWNQLLDTDYLKRAFPRWRMWGMRPLFASIPISREVEMISGACLMVKREVFERVRGFCSDYFMYGEDLDLCYQITRAGYVLRYAGLAEVIHHGGGSSARRTGFWSDVLIRDSIWRFLHRSRGRLYANVFKGTMVAAALVRMAMLTLLWPFAGTRATYALRKWSAILHWAAGLTYTQGHAPA